MITLVLAILVMVGVGVLIWSVFDHARESANAKVKPAPPPIILTEWGPVTDWARKQASANMLADADLRARVYQVVLRECGGDEAKGTAEFYRRFPELQETDSA